MVGFLKFVLGVGTAFAQETASSTSSSSEKAAPFDILGFVIAHLPLWITAAIILIVSMVLAFIVKKWVESRIATKLTEEHQEVLLISGRISFVAVAAIGITIALAVAGINLTTIIAGVAFGISFGLQDTVANFVAGLGMLASQQFSIGDWVSIGGQIAKVENIRTRATFMKTYDGLRMVVPNAVIYKAKMINYSANPIRRMKVPVYCRYNIDYEQVKKICVNVCKANPKVYLEPKPNLVYKDLGDYYVELQLRFWVDSKGPWRKVQSAVFMECQKKLEEAGLDSPYPVTQMDLMEDGEAYVFNTRAVDPATYDALKAARDAENEEFDKRRAELVKTRAASSTTMRPEGTAAIYFKNPITPVTGPPVPFPEKGIRAVAQAGTPGEAKPATAPQTLFESFPPSPSAFQPVPTQPVSAPTAISPSGNAPVAESLPSGTAAPAGTAVPPVAQVPAAPPVVPSPEPQSQQPSPSASEPSSTISGPTVPPSAGNPLRN